MAANTTMFVDFTALDLEAIIPGPVRVNQATKSKSIPLLIGNKPIVIKTPKMPVPVVWGKDDKPDQCTIELSFRGKDADGENAGDPNLATFHQKVSDFDERVLDIATANSVEWFKKSIDRESMRSIMFNPFLRKSDAYPPSIRAKMYVDKNLKIFDQNKDLMDVTDPQILRGCNMVAIIMCTGVWISGQGFGTTWKVVQARTYPRSRVITGDGATASTHVDPIDIGDFSIDKIEFGASRASGSGKSAYVNYDGTKPLVFQTPMMHTPFGISCWPDEASGNNKYTIDLSFKGMDADGDVKSFYDMLIALESKVKTDWAGKIPGAQVAMMLSVIKTKLNSDYPPTVKINVPSDLNGITLDVRDVDDQPLNGADNIMLFSGATVSMIVTCTGAWMHGSRMGISLKAVKAVLVPNPSSINYGLADDDDDITNIDDGNDHDLRAKLSDTIIDRRTYIEDDPEA